MEEKKRELPPIREGKDVRDNEPKVICERKVAALPPPTEVEGGA